MFYQQYSFYKHVKINISSMYIYTFIICIYTMICGKEKKMIQLLYIIKTTIALI